MLCACIEQLFVHPAFREIISPSHFCQSVNERGELSLSNLWVVVFAMSLSMSLFPLESVSEAQLQRLCQTLWRWDWCDICTSGQSCGSTSCPWRRWKRLSPLFLLYKGCTASYVPELLIDTHPVLSGHEDLLRIIQLLQDKRATPRGSLMEEYTSSFGDNVRPEESDMHRAFNIAFKTKQLIFLTLGPSRWSGPTATLCRSSSNRLSLLETIQC